MQQTFIDSFLGPLCISWSDLGLEKIDIATVKEKNSPASPPLPSWVQVFLAELQLYLDHGVALRQLPPINQSRWTPFQKEIYLQLFATKLGETLTYGELAKRCARPKAARSVGAAMSRNTLPLLIPCHRVLPASGKLGQYSGGEGPLSKEKLLRFEQNFL